MKTADAIARLSFTISKENKPNQNDKEALNQIIRDFNKQGKENVQNNMLFAKLYAVMLANNGTSIVENNKRINEILSKPLGHHLDFLLMILQQQNLNNYFASKSIFDPLLNKESFEEYKTMFPEISADGIKYALEAWNIDNLTAHFVFTVNQSLINFKDNV